MEILIIAVIIGLIPAAIANSKGHSFFAWWFFGAALWIVALPMAIFMKRNLPESMLECSACGKGVAKQATACPHCGQPTTGQFMVVATGR